MIMATMMTMMMLKDGDDHNDDDDDGDDDDGDGDDDLVFFPIMPAGLLKGIFFSVTNQSALL